MSQQRTLTKVEVVLYALYGLGGDKHYVHVEDIALRCYGIAPEKFSWERHPEYPDADAARSALTDAAKAQHGALVVKSREVSDKATRKGKAKRKGDVRWALSRAGVEWMEANIERLTTALGHPQELRAGQEPRQEVRRQIESILRHPAYVAYADDGDAAVIDEATFVDSLRCTLNTPARVLIRRMDVALTRAQTAKHDGLIRYLEFCRRRFGHLFGSQ
jgi:hypothetical protein